MVRSPRATSHRYLLKMTCCLPFRLRSPAPQAEGTQGGSIPNGKERQGFFPEENAVFVTSGWVAKEGEKLIDNLFLGRILGAGMQVRSVHVREVGGLTASEYPHMLLHCRIPPSKRHRRKFMRVFLHGRCGCPDQIQLFANLQSANQFQICPASHLFSASHACGTRGLAAGCRIDDMAVPDLSFVLCWILHSVMSA